VKRVAIYARVSTGQQDCETQILTLKEYAQNRGLEVTGIYQDAGLSGASVTRPQLDALMMDARRRRFDTVLVFRFDRFARSVKHLLQALEEFRSLGIDFISFSEAIDTGTPMGKMIFTMVGAIAEFERDLIKERVQAGIHRAKAQGKKLGRPRAAIDMDRARELQKEGKSLREIARVLNCGKSTLSMALRKAS
jgi:DNA invertase Pin-like site-specific DNA recombinase